MLTPQGKDYKQDSTVSYDLAGLGAILINKKAPGPRPCLKVIELWERETGKDYDRELAKIFGDSLLNDISKAIKFEPSDNMRLLGKGLAAWPRAPKEKAPEPADGLWLLWQFLLQLPKGEQERRFCISDPRLWPNDEAKNFWTEFRK